MTDQEFLQRIRKATEEARSLEEVDTAIEAAINRKDYLFAIEIMVAAGQFALAQTYTCDFDHGKLNTDEKIRVIEMFHGAGYDETARAFCRKWLMSAYLSRSHCGLYEGIYPKRVPSVKAG